MLILVWKSWSKPFSVEETEACEGVTQPFNRARALPFYTLEVGAGACCMQWCMSQMFNDFLAFIFHGTRSSAIRNYLGADLHPHLQPHSRVSWKEARLTLTRGIVQDTVRAPYICYLKAYRSTHRPLCAPSAYGTGVNISVPSRFSAVGEAQGVV